MPIFNITNGQTSSNTHSSQLVVTTEGESGTLVKLEGDNLSTALTKSITSDGTVTFSNLIDGDYQVSMKSDIHTDYTDPRKVSLKSNYSIRLSPFKATVTVIFPAGQTCTATNGSITLSSTSSPWTCYLLESGTWTFKLSTGFYQILYPYNNSIHTIDKWYIYQKGNEYDDLTNGWGSTPIMGALVRKYADGIEISKLAGKSTAKLFPEDPINLKGFTTLKAVGSITTQINASSSKLYLGCEANNEDGDNLTPTHPDKPTDAHIPTENFVSSNSTVQEYELSLDITSIEIPPFGKKIYPYFLIYNAEGTFNSMWVEC